ncbi:hypothetical protein N7495_005079 [Penicillium taxi]|uniref:uncharacterized protein n=1 Tax=Penicillium taxi TaxID=168475 RepID=UPI002544E812|nr:uncharacterized protein N7495_005079 [Penicillium taxi]KAJ5893388.1 hypothetical protein N7495_005079 [Penicillium taxi]
MQASTPAALLDRRDSQKASDPIRGSPASIKGPERPHQRLVFTDPVALRYLEEDPSTDILHRRCTLQGYEIYIVEQWACSRIHPTFVISTYTGDPSHTVIVGVLVVPTNEETWSARLKMYFNAMKQYHARKKETPLGTVMVTDLGSFPSALTVIPVPQGDIKKHREDFIVNEDLKRLGCAGRAGLKLQDPVPATAAKFYQLYRTSERVPLYNSVVELVKQCQIALMIFGKLAPEYVDGLLCDVTEKAIRDWWTDIGTDLYNIELGDGILGPTTVAALLGTLLGARNRLHACGAPVGKDAFDIDNLKRGISNFQKAQRMHRSCNLDRQTLDRLHRATARAANTEGWTDAVKSTMTELSGQGGEMVMSMVRGRDKGGVGDIETLDLDIFVQYVYGSRAKWLWLGKSRKHGNEQEFSQGPGTDMMFTTDDQGGYVWTSQKKHSTEDLQVERVPSGLNRQWKAPESLPAEDKEHRRKGVSERVSDARAGLGRFKDAVGLPGLRSHHNKHSREGIELTHDAAYNPHIDSDTELSAVQSRTGSNLPDAKAGEELEPRPDDDRKSRSKPTAVVESSSDAKTPEIHIESVPPEEDKLHVPQQDLLDIPQFDAATDDESDIERVMSRSTTGSSEGDRDQTESVADLAMLALRRSQSCEQIENSATFSQRKDEMCPRHLSFSWVEEVVLHWNPICEKPIIKETANFEEAIMQEEIMASELCISSSRILKMGELTVPWVERQVTAVEDLNQVLYDRHEELSSVYLERMKDYQCLQDTSNDILMDEHSGLNDSVKRVELLGAKLDYELHVLASKVEDMEEGLSDFERHIVNVETRFKSLLKGEEEHSVSWMTWVRRSFGFAQ